MPLVIVSFYFFLAYSNTYLLLTFLYKFELLELNRVNSDTLICCVSMVFVFLEIRKSECYEIS